MPASQTSYEHILLNEKGIPFIEGTTTKVIELVAEKKAYGWSPEEIHFQHPYLTPGQIYSALAYYSDHSDHLDSDLERRLAAANHEREIAGESPLAARVKSGE